MADNQRVLKKNADDGFLAEDDPLAELARIVNFDLPVTPSRARISTPRREPEFNLEDELLKGLEQYEVGDEASTAPSAPIGSAPATQAQFAAPAVDHEVRYSAAPVARELWTDPPLEPVVNEPAVYAPLSPEPAEALSAQDSSFLPSPGDSVFDAAPQPRLDPVGRSLFDLEEEIMQEFAAFDARRSVPATVKPFEPVFARREPEPPAFDAAPTPQPVAQQAVESFEADAWRLEDADFAEQLADLDIDAEPENGDLHQRPQEVDEADWDAEADFPADTLVEALEDELHRSMADMPDLSVAAGADHDNSDRVEPALGSWATPASRAPLLDDDAFWRQPATKEPVAVDETVRDAEPSTADAMALDRLLADVERYPVVRRTGWSRSTAFGTAGEKIVSPIAEPELAGPSASSPTAFVASDVPVIPAIIAPPSATAAEKADDIVVEAADEDDFPFFSDGDLFDENAFELDLREIELDLLDVMDDAPPARPIAAAPAPNPIDDSYPAVESVAMPAREAPMVIDAAPARPSVADYASLPFDPSQISAEEDVLEALAEIDVPELPVVDHEPASTDPADYDLDIDADMAEFFAARPDPAPSILPSRSAGRVEAPAAVAPPEKATGDFDEFEKALEEDFRRSLSENRATVNLDRVALSPVDIEDARDMRGRSRRVLVLAASVFGVAVLGAAGVYAFMGGTDGLVATSGEPKIILADKEPMKVAPQNPGGQKVPNQDKAVYDRVSGANTEEAKQPRLVTSNEEPVDVVQKTLMPESLPMDDEQEAMGTPTEDTTDARLLPEGATENVSTSEKVATGVAPRKVRTMIVRPDGSLVPREEIVSETAATTPDAPAADTQPAEVPERLPPDDISRTIEQASADPGIGQEQAARSVALDATTPQPEANNETDAAETTAETPTVSADQAAIAAASQADVPDAAETSDRSSAETAPQQTAPAETVETASAPANTPVPSSRPAEQPVNVIGAVTDQGRVTDGQPAEAQTASAAPQAEAPVAQTPTPAGSYVIQIASLPSQSDAETSYKRLSVKFAGVIGGRGVDIKRAQIANKGTYYRVRIPAGSKQEAQDLCARYKAAGGSCLVSK